MKLRPRKLKIPIPNFTRLTIEDTAETVPQIEKFDESLTPNMRALRLVLTISEQLLSMGVAAGDVVHMAVAVTNTYTRRRVHIDVNYTMITVSQDRGNDREPLTLIRTISPQDPNYQMIESLQSIMLEIRDKKLPLEEAEEKVDKILSTPKEHPAWLRYIAGGTMAAGVVVMYDGAPIMILLTFIMGSLVSALPDWTSKISLPTFYDRAVTSFIITIMGAMIAWMNTEFNLLINPTLFVIGGIVMLVAGLMIVGAFQDAIDEYYVTATARLMKVLMATGGIVAGVLMGLYVATQFNISFPATPDRLSIAEVRFQYIGALIIAATFALKNHITIPGMVAAGLVGMLGWWASEIIGGIGLGVVIASGMAAAMIGLLATLVSRIWKIPSMAIIATGVVPLVPGLSLYNGLMGVTENPPGDPGFMFALAALGRAVMIGFAIAAGAALGSLVGRPIRKKALKVYNHLPKYKLSK